jgi:undecaprenyl-phosphate 4-deoxy-4-formamido-L-arabinose transferase
MPLRIATLIGLVMAVIGLLSLAAIFYLRLTGRGPNYGWGSLMGALLVFSGTQLVMLGLIGEYVGRMFLTINGRPQSVVRSVERGG